MCINTCVHYFSSKKKTLHQAVRGYSAQCDGELSFAEGTFIKELSDVSKMGLNLADMWSFTFELSPLDQ